MATEVSGHAQISNTWARYTLALVAITLALIVRCLLDPVLGNYTPFITLFAAVAFSAAYAGLGPSILATVLGLLGATYWFVPPRGSWSIWNVQAHALASLIYVIICMLIASAGEMMPKGQGQAEHRR
jgi:K+-sensing histidine kinase KdpD